MNISKSKHAAVLVSLIGLVTVFIYAYGRYDLGISSFFAAEPGITQAGLSCRPLSATGYFGTPVTFEASGGNAKAGKTPQYAWSALRGTPSTGDGVQFTTTFAKTDKTTKTVTVTSRLETAKCTVTLTNPPTPSTSIPQASSPTVKPLPVEKFILDPDLLPCYFMDAGLAESKIRSDGSQLLSQSGYTSYSKMVAKRDEVVCGTVPAPVLRGVYGPPQWGYVCPMTICIYGAQ